MSRKSIFALVALAPMAYPGVANAIQSQQSSPLPKDWPAIVGGRLNNVNVTRSDTGYSIAQISIGGAIHDGYFPNRRQIYDGGFVTFDLNMKYSRFRANIGSPDDWRDKESTFKIIIDGEVVLEGKAIKGESAIPLELDLTDARSLRIDYNRVCIASPTFIKMADKASPPRVGLLSPSTTARVKQGETKLSWKAMEGAVGYTVRIVATKFDAAQPAEAQRMWVFSVHGTETMVVDLTTFPTGEYSWEITAFDEKSVLGLPSESRRLVIVN